MQGMGSCLLAGFCPVNRTFSVEINPPLRGPEISPSVHVVNCWTGVIGKFSTSIFARPLFKDHGLWLFPERKNAPEDRIGETVQKLHDETTCGRVFW